MPKQKTHKGTAKRVKITGTGKFLVEPAGGGHLMTKKSSSRKRRYAKDVAIDPANLRAVKKLI